MEYHFLWPLGFALQIPQNLWHQLVCPLENNPEQVFLPLRPDQ